MGRVYLLLWVESRVRKMNIVNVMDIEEFKEDPVCLAFTTYVCDDLNISEMNFTKVDKPFGAMSVMYELFYIGKGGIVCEFYIVGTKEGLPMAMVNRGFTLSGSISENSLGFIQYAHMPYHKDGVLQIVRDLPRIAPTKNIILKNVAATTKATQH
tara:strand:+ start:706 stop:1170 length:465 start_codon:yes stop_codon:yes gene_type:complete